LRVLGTEIEDGNRLSHRGAKAPRLSESSGDEASFDNSTIKNAIGRFRERSGDTGPRFADPAPHKHYHNAHSEKSFSVARLQIEHDPYDHKTSINQKRILPKAGNRLRKPW
jgi:hypothetical protein